MSYLMITVPSIIDILIYMVGHSIIAGIASSSNTTVIPMKIVTTVITIILVPVIILRKISGFIFYVRNLFLNHFDVFLFP